MQRPSAAESYQRTLARVVAALDGDHADGSLHLRLDDAQDARCKFLGRRNGAFPLAHGPRSPIEIQVYPTTQKALWIQPPKQKVGIGDRRLCAAAKADRARLGASRLRPYMQHACRIEARD